LLPVPMKSVRRFASMGERRVPLYVDGGQLKLCLCLRELTFRLIERCLKWPGVDLEQDLAALYD
jgi:hypothetical protein